MLAMTTETEWYYTTETFSPERAQEFLSKHGNQKNRNLNPNRVNVWKKDMVHNWIVSPLTALGVGKSGILLNGHHRLTAVAKGDIDVTFIVFWNVDDEVLRAVDINLTRNSKQIGKMFDQETGFDEALKAILASYGRTDYCSPFKMEERRNKYADVIESHGALLKSIRIAGRPIRAGALGGWLLILRNEKLAVSFLHDFAATAEKAILGHKSSRNLIQWLENRSGVHARLAGEAASAVVNAYNQYVSGKELSSVYSSTSCLKKYEDI